MNNLRVSKEPALGTGTGTLTANIQIENSAAALSEELKKHGFLHGLAVVWQMQSVLWGRVEDGQLTLAGSEEPTPEYWQELRVFNAEAEIHLVRQGDKLFGRFRSDAGGTKPIKYIEAASPLWGIRDKNQNGIPQGYIRLSDYGRGLELIIPVDKDEPAEQYSLITRNYIETDKETQQAGYADYRFLKIEAVDKKGA